MIRRSVLSSCNFHLSRTAQNLILFTARGFLGISAPFSSSVLFLYSLEAGAHRFEIGCMAREWGLYLPLLRRYE